MKSDKYWLIGLLLIAALFIRVVPINFPFLTTDEARIAFRGYVLATSGKDELGRLHPILFNSLIDYKLPAVSYLAAFGEKLLGKSDFGVRMPFILLGVGLVLLIYKIAQIFSPRKEFWLLSAAIIAFSPGLIFLSKIPNESILLTFAITLLFYLLTRAKVNLILVLSAVAFSLLVSKFAWFVIPPFILFSLMFYQDDLSKKLKISITILSFFLSFLALGLFLQVPQSHRSLSENNFPIFSDITIKNGIDKLRGQGIEAGWSPSLARLLFNKSHFLIVGFLHLLSNLNLSVFFSQFDKSGNLNFFGMGAFPKAAIIPALAGVIFLIKQRKAKFLLFPLIVTFPAALIYPEFNPGSVVLAIPFVAFLIAFGFFYLKKIFAGAIIFFMMFELLINFIFLSPQVKFTNDIRPNWVEPILKDVYNLSKVEHVLISDNIASDLTPFIGWYTNFNPEDAFENIPYAYKFHQTDLGRIKIVGSSDEFRNCGIEETKKFFSSKRDLERVKKLNTAKVGRIYLNSKDDIAAYLIEKGVCIN